MLRSSVTLASVWLVLIIVLAVASGVFLVFLWNLLRRRRLRKDIERIRARSIRNPDYGRPITDSQASDTAYTPADQGHFLLESVRIKNFKNITELRLDFTRESALTGQWTCIAGINGAGKSTILQALCLVLLGSDHVGELGKPRLGRMLRRTADGPVDGEIEAMVQKDGVRQRLYIPLMTTGHEEGALDEDTLRAQLDFPEMRNTWNQLRKQILVSYGASRNVSDDVHPQAKKYGRLVERQITLFDPLAQIASVDVLLQGGKSVAPVLETLYRLLQVVLGAEGLVPEQSDGGAKLRFSQHDTAMDVIDLPDGFRSTVAWLADICAAWHEREEGENDNNDPNNIMGIVMLDEIGLHLHPSLEKSLVPQLRRALPKVQFIVSTHSPLVLSSFDRRELVMLDAGSPTGTRELDRQVFGFSMDDIYAWLMDTSPGSQVMEEMLEESSDPELAVFLYQSKDVNEAEAREIIAKREDEIAELRREANKS